MARRKNKDLHYILGGGKIAAPTGKSSGGMGMQPKPSAAPRVPAAAQPSGTGGGMSGMGGGAKAIGGGAGAGASSAQVK